jgi:ABC-2 type transport system ATP-binding protein
MAIELDDVSKDFGTRLVLDRLSLKIEQGRVVGFVGLNGAGKTTTIRILLGLLAPTRGRALVLGASYRETESLGLVGGLVDRPAFPSHLTAADGLRLFGRMRGLRGPRLEADVAVALARLGCSGFAARRIRELSTGMRERLGLALAFLGDPEVVVLDEPTEGLDPEGVVALRRLIVERANAGATVLFSSHLLSEVEVLADRVVIIHQGRIVADAPKDELRRSTSLRIQFDSAADVRLALDRLSAVGFTCHPDKNLDVALLVESDDGARVNRSLAEFGIFAAEITKSQPSLEGTLLKLAGSTEWID